MKTNRSLEFISVLFVAVLACAGCNKEEPASAPAQAPAITNAPVVAPGAETNVPVAAMSPATNVAAATVITPEEAKDHIGEDATVRGKVFGVHVTQKGDVFINIGAAYPNQPFTAVCFQGAIPAEDLKKFNGKTVSVKGEIKEYNGQVEIVIESADQISQ